MIILSESRPGGSCCCCVGGWLVIGSEGYVEINEGGGGDGERVRCAATSLQSVAANLSKGHLATTN